MHQWRFGLLRALVAGAGAVTLSFAGVAFHPPATAAQIPSACETLLVRIGNLKTEISQREAEHPVPSDLTATLDMAVRAQRTAQDALRDAEAAVTRARRDFASDPTLLNGQELTRAKNELDRATTALRNADQDVRNARNDIFNDPEQRQIRRLKQALQEREADARQRGCGCNTTSGQFQARRAVAATCTLGNPKNPPKKKKRRPARTDPCRASPAPCFVQIEVNGFPPGAEEQEEWGDGVVTVDSATSQPTFAQDGGFIPGSWAAQFDPDSGCANGYDAVNECYQFQWERAETVTLTAYPVPEGGFSADTAPPDASPSWASTFAGWGGDCAAAGMSTTCTLRLGRQRPTTGDGGQSGYSLDVVAYFVAEQAGLG